MTALNFYQVLGIAPDASASEVRAAYTRLVKRHHPDIAGELPTRLNELQQAYRCLSDPGTRAEHDRRIAEHHRRHLERQRRLHRRLDRYDRHHPPPPLPWYRRWRALLMWAAAISFLVSVVVGLFGAEAG